MLQKTPLNEWHRAANGRLVDFAGWEMPIQYSTIVDEHQAVRTACGLFDICHMGRVHVRGDQAWNFLNRVVTIDVLKLPVGRIRYALATNEQGGVKDDVLVYRLPEEFLVVVNASNRLKLLEFWGAIASEFPGVELHDATLETAMIAVQGPLAASVLGRYAPACGELKYYHSRLLEILGAECLVSRTGYTGEDGFEIIASAARVPTLWAELLAGGQGEAIRACGLGCRDTLRLEAGMPLYGHELTEEIDPVTAGLEFAVHFEKPEFIGASRIREIRQQGPSNLRVGLELPGKRIAREHAGIFDSSGQSIGEVTSGTFSPTLQKPIAMGYVPVEYSAIGTELAIDVRGKLCPALVTGLPFYRRG